MSDTWEPISEPDEWDEVDADTQAAIKEGLEDIRKGRTISLDEYRRSRNL
jgi:predicted transcriptional regulator